SRGGRRAIAPRVKGGKRSRASPAARCPVRRVSSTRRRRLKLRSQERIERAVRKPASQAEKDTGRSGDDVARPRTARRDRLLDDLRNRFGTGGEARHR